MEETKEENVTKLEETLKKIDNEVTPKDRIEGREVLKLLEEE